MLSQSVVSDSRLLCPWNFPSKNTRVRFHSLLQGIFLTQGSNPCLLCLLHWQVNSLPTHLSGKPTNKVEDLSTVTAASKANVFWSPAVAIPESDSESFGGKQKETNTRGVGNVERERERQETLLQISGSQPKFICSEIHLYSISQAKSFWFPGRLGNTGEKRGPRWHHYFLRLGGKF